MKLKLLDDNGNPLDGVFEIGEGRDIVAITLHSKGGSKAGSITNGDYNTVLELILERLCPFEVEITDVFVDSTVARKVPVDDRRLDLRYPIPLTPGHDVRALRIAITEAQPDVASTRPSGNKGGNKHRRIRIEVATTEKVATIRDALGAYTNVSEDLYLAELGTDYFDDPAGKRLAPSQVFSRDDSKLERSLEGHTATQRALAAKVRSLGFEPRKRAVGEPDYDIAWTDGRGVVVAEVKSLRGSDVAKQLRLGIGQVLHYRYLLEKRHHQPVKAVLATERDPGTPWPEICASAGIVLTWPPSWDDLGAELV